MTKETYSPKEQISLAPLPDILERIEQDAQDAKDAAREAGQSAQQAEGYAKEASLAGEKAAKEVFDRADKKIDTVINALVELAKADCKSRREFNDNYLEDVNKILGSLTI